MTKAEDAIKKAIEEHEERMHYALARPSQPMKERTYTVKEGDTLAKIAKAELGQSGRHMEILALNRIKTGDDIFVGQVLKLPG